jgi:general secretion pathway protein D
LYRLRHLCIVILMAGGLALRSQSTFIGENAASSSATPAILPTEETVEGGINAQIYNQPVRLAPLHETKNIHLHGNTAQVLKESMRLYGIDVSIDGQPASRTLCADLEDADFATTERVLEWMTNLFFVPVSSSRVLAFTDTPENRKAHLLTETETFYLASASEEEKKMAADMFGKIFDLPKATVSDRSITVRATPETMTQVKQSLLALFTPAPGVSLRIRMYIWDKSHDRDLGIIPSQSVTGFSVLTEAENLINSNSSIVEEWISDGLVSASDTLEIALLLIEDGYASSSLLSGNVVSFGGGDTQMGVNFSSPSANLSLSDSLVTDIKDTTLQLADGMSGTFRVGERYPIQMSTFTTPLTSTTTTVTPSVQYEDLGLTLQAEPHVQGNGNILLGMRWKMQSLHGTTLNNMPILDHQDVTSTLIVPVNQETILTSYVTREQEAVLTGVPIATVTNASKDTTDDMLILTITPQLTFTNHPGVSSRPSTLCGNGVRQWERAVSDWYPELCR